MRHTEHFPDPPERDWLREQSARARAEAQQLANDLDDGAPTSEAMRCRLMIDGWEFVRMGHQILANTQAAPSNGIHTERAREAEIRGAHLTAIVEAMAALHKRQAKR